MDTRTREPTTVGEMLNEEFMKPLGVSQQKLAEAMGVSRKVIGQIVNNQRRLSLTEILLISELFESSAEFWINLQAAHDRWEARMATANRKTSAAPFGHQLAHG